MITKKLLSKRSISLFIILILLTFCLILIKYFNINTNKRYHHHIDSMNHEDYISEIKSDNTVDSNFTTHLPLIILDTNGEKPKADSSWDDEKGYFTPLNHDPYVKGSISIIDNSNGLNHISDSPNIESDIKIRLRGNTSLTFDKKQYFIKLIDSAGNKNIQNILGMGTEHEWILNISFIDKSLLRNYLALNIAGEIIPNTPDVRYCEVLIKNNNTYEYEGVYLMMESVKQDENRVNISDYDNKFFASSYLLRRDRYDETGIILDNYGRLNNLTTGYLDIKYPSQNDITTSTLDYITNEISEFEKALFSNDPNEFYKYRDFIDQNSFIDYFIINELFANYDSGYHSTYSYKEVGGKINMGPVWDFDMSMDNIKKLPSKLDSTAMHDAPWFRQILKDANFTTKLIERYHELRENILSNENLIKYIDGTTSFLDNSIKRDWDRWGYFYTSDYLFDTIDKNGNVINRNTKTYDEEIQKIKTTLVTHGNWLDENIDSLYQFSEFSEDDIEKNTFEKSISFLLGSTNDISTSNILSIIFIIIFIVSIVLIMRD